MGFASKVLFNPKIACLTTPAASTYPRNFDFSGKAKLSCLSLSDA
jgi:hypothetical protein